ncbi:sugar transferase [Labilibacter marinus]|uniref:sugar transferase n=1 Tax=Labilibacter marinus TaxID=1477105 RepID=UPI00083711D8|nr:sugar transferase [Labilibacter marinus]
MIREREKVIERGSVIFQALLSMGCFYIAWLINDLYINPTQGGLREYQIIFILILPIWYVLLDHLGMGRMARTRMYSYIFFEYFSVVGIGNALLFIVAGILEMQDISRWVMVSFMGINFFVLFVYKAMAYKTMKILRGRGYNYKHVIIIADKDSIYFIDRIIETKDWGYKLLFIVTNSPVVEKKYGHRFQIIPDNGSLPTIIDEGVVDEVMFCKGDFNQDKIRDLVNLCAEVGVTFRMQSELLSLVGGRSYMSYFNQLPFLTFMSTPNNYLALKMKSIMDYIGAFLILLLISPVLLFIAISIKIDDGGPIFFKQVRVGQNGRKFFCLKFRTMVTNAEDLKDSLMDQNEQEGPVFKMKDDPRVTKVGRFLRKSSLDELPQFFNVLKGEMSIVGPRPPVPKEVEEYERWQRRRLSMKPGITCIWQVSGRNDIPFEQWMKMDMQYIDTWSLKLDFMLFLKTFKVMVVKDGQ